MLKKPVKAVSQPAVKQKWPKYQRNQFNQNYQQHVKNKTCNNFKQSRRHQIRSDQKFGDFSSTEMKKHQENQRNQFNQFNKQWRSCDILIIWDKNNWKSVKSDQKAASVHIHTLQIYTETKTVRKQISDQFQQLRNSHTVFDPRTWAEKWTLSLFFSVKLQLSLQNDDLNSSTGF